MTHTDDTSPGTAFSRRRLVGAASALGLAAAGATIAAGPAAANAEGSDPNNDAAGNPLGGGDPGEISATAIPALTAGYSYFTGSQFDFHSNSAAAGAIRVITGDGTYSVSNYVVCPLRIPAGTRVRELTIFAVASAGSSTLTLQQYSLDGTGSSTSVVAAVIPGGTTSVTPITVPCDFTTDAGKTYDLEMFTSTASSKVFSFRIGAQPAAAFVPITPYRAYDSRKPAVPNPGIMAPNTSRVVSIVNAIDDNGAIITPNVIPSTARAVTYNITATLTTGDNFLAVAPGLAASTTVSAINFAVNQTLANAATVSLDNGTVKVFCGNNTGSSHFILDITGYYI